MNLQPLAITTVLAAIGFTVPVQAQDFLRPTPVPTLIAGWPTININVPSGSNSNGGGSGGGASDNSSTQAFKGFSGQYTEYADTYNGFRLKIPAEFTLHEKGATTDWTGPLIDGGSALIYINATPMKGVASKTAYDINLKAKQQDRNYTDIVPLQVRIGNKTALAFRCKEATNKPGTPDLKSATDHHRWHLFVFGNGMIYTLGFTGPYASFQSNKLQTVYDAVIQSVELIPLS